MRITEQQYLTAIRLIQNYSKQIQIEIDSTINPILNSRFIDSDLSVRTINALKFARKNIKGNDGNWELLNCNLETFQDVIDVGKNCLKRQRNFGKKSLQELEAYLDRYNLKLRR